MKKALAVLLSILTILAVLSACSKEPEPEPQEPVEQTPQEPVETYDIINPLTGEALDTDISQNRPYAFVLNNLQRALPQCGVQSADIIIEAPVEGGISRMLGIFQDITDVGPIGSIRSARPYLVDLSLAFDSIFIHAGGSPQAYEELASKDVLHFDGVNGRTGTQIFYRDEDRRATAGYEHSLFTDSSLIEEYISPMDIRHEHEAGYEYAQTYETEAQPAGGSAADDISVIVSGSKETNFKYDGESKKYLISEYDEAYTDGNTDAQVSCKNVIVLVTDVSRISGDTEGRLEVRTTGTGTGYFACEGKLIPISWSRDDVYSQFEFTTEDGSPLSLGRGNSYICITSSDDNVSYQ